MLTAADMRKAGVKPQDAAFAYQQCLSAKPILAALGAAKGGKLPVGLAFLHMTFLLYWLGSTNRERGLNASAMQVLAAEKQMEALAEKLRIAAVVEKRDAVLSQLDVTLLAGALGNWRGPGHGGEAIPVPPT
jgi:hypothetical protein